MTRLNTFNDGIAYIYRERDDRNTDFNAKRNVKSLSDMDFIVKLAFGRNSKRQQDQEFASQMGFQLTEKIHTRKVKTVDSKCKAVIDDYLYDIAYIDNGGNGTMYLYLEGVRALVNAE